MIDTVFLNGTVGAGKSTIAAALSVLMTESGRHHAVIDLDHIRRAWPTPEGDRFNHELELLNLRDLVVNYRNAGIEHFVLAGVVEQATEVPRYEAALKSRGLLLCRLDTDGATLIRRLSLRHADNPTELAWHLRRAGELAAVLQRAAIYHVVVDASGDAPMATAREVMHCGSFYDQCWATFAGKIWHESEHHEIQRTLFLPRTSAMRAHFDV